MNMMMEDEEVVQMIDDDEVENVGIMSGFMDDIEELMEEISEAEMNGIEEGEDADMARMMNRTPDSPEILMNNLRGDMRSIDARREELADLVGMRQAEETPEGVLALLQPVLAQQDAMAAMPMPAPQMPPQMPPPPMPPMPAQPAGIESITVDETVVPAMYRGGSVQNFNRGSGQMGVTPAQSMSPSGVRYYANGTPEEGVVSSAGSYAPELRQPAIAYLTQVMNQSKAPIPDLQTTMAKELAMLESLGLGTDKNAIKSQVLSDIGQAALQFGSNVGSSGQPMRGSAAARLSEAFAPLAGKIGARAGKASDEAKALKLLAIKNTNDKIAAAKASNAALDKSQTDAAIKLAQQPKQTARGAEIEFLRGSGLSNEQIVERLFPGKSLTGSAQDLEVLRSLGVADENVVGILFGSKSSRFAEQKAFLEGLGLPGGDEALASRLGLGLPKDQQPTDFQVKVKMMEDADFTPEQILDRIAPPNKPSAFREQFDMLIATGDYSPEAALNLLVGDKATARDQRIEDIMKATGRTRDQVVLDLEKELRLDNITGNFALYDPNANKLTPVVPDWTGVEGANAPRVTAPIIDQEKLNPLISEGQGTGLFVAIADKLNSTIGQIFPGMSFESEREAAGKIKTINVAINDAFTGGGRSPVITLTMLQELMPTAREAFLNPDDAAEQYMSTANYLAQVYADDLRGAKDPTLGQGGMRDAANRAEGVLNALQLLVTPDTLTEIIATANTGANANTQFSTMGAAEITAITPEERQAFTPLQLAAFYDRTEELLKGAD